ncbi:MAG: nuclear transport factor 2 family protein [Emcibacter sp.]|nr:nuclear transport factor 2 family protein [Emcibacter sp.]
MMTDTYLSLKRIALHGAMVILVAALLFLRGTGVYSAQAMDDMNAADEAAIRIVLTEYHAALTTENIKLVEKYVVTDARFAMVEGKHTNWGWADYRDNHLTPELAGLSKVDFRLEFKAVHVSGNMAYSSFIYHISPKGDPSQNYGSGRGTVVLIRNQDGWLIQHFHTS